MSTTPTATTHVPQLRMPGQAAAPDGPADMTFMYLFHHAYRRDLADFAAAVPRTPVEEASTWRALEARWELFARVLHHHHESEDTFVWPELMQRATVEERAVLEAREAEHAEIDPMLDACRDGLAAMTQRPTRETRDALAVRMAAAREALGRHLAHEETEAIALLQRVLSHEEWEEIDARFKETLPKSLLLRIVPWVLHGVGDEVRARIFAKPGGAGFRLVWAVSRRRFARQDACAFAHRS